VQQCSSTADSDCAPDCPDDSDTVQYCSSDTDSSSDIDVNMQISADAQHAARGDSQQRSDTSANVERNRFLSAERQCRLCKTGHGHLFFECAAGRFPSLRDALLLDAPLQYWCILAAIRDAVLDEDHLEIYDRDVTGNADKATFANANRAQAHWLTHRLLWVMPWSAHSVPPSASAAYALGELFDDTVLSRHALRPMVDSWVGWAAKWTRMFGDEWTSHRQTLSADASASSSTSLSTSVTVVPVAQPS
jgi:hypothetical protein